MKAQIQIQFPLLGEWDKLNMTAVFPSSGGFIESRIYTENDIPPSHAPALEAVVEALVSMGAPWQVQQVGESGAVHFQGSGRRAGKSY